jgi:hypothetical protein
LVEGRLLYSDGSRKRHAILPSLAEAAQLQAAARMYSGDSNRKRRAGSAILSTHAISLWGGGGVELCV